MTTAVAQNLHVQPAAPGAWVLPAPPGQARVLALSDFATAARELACETAAVRAVGRVESGGRSGFDEKKRPALRYEGHYFQRLTHSRYDRSHPDLSNAYRSPQYRATHNLSGERGADQQWGLLHRAFALAPDAAVMSCSWGMFQVMGENARTAGWPDLRVFVTDMFASEHQHLRAFLGHCRHKGLTRYLQTRNWARFAFGYNGKRYADHDYHGQMARYYAQYARG
jgi:hypothetical protein